MRLVVAVVAVIAKVRPTRAIMQHLHGLLYGTHSHNRS